MDFRMRLTGSPMKAFPNDLLIVHDHTTDPRIRIGGVKPFLRQLQRLRHITVIVLAKQGAHFGGSLVCLTVEEDS